MRPFLPLRDPLFWLASALFLANGLFLKRVFESAWLHSFFNDLLCLPVVVPLQIAIFRGLGWRKSVAPPSVSEILGAFCFWSMLFEVVMPRLQLLEKWGNFDALDVLHYGAGGVWSWLFWRWFYENKKEQH